EPQADHHAHSRASHEHASVVRHAASCQPPLRPAKPQEEPRWFGSAAGPGHGLLPAGAWDWRPEMATRDRASGAGATAPPPGTPAGIRGRGNASARATAPRDAAAGSATTATAAPDLSATSRCAAISLATAGQPLATASRRTIDWDSWLERV